MATDSDGADGDPGAAISGPTEFLSGGHRVIGHLARPAAAGGHAPPAVIFAHGFPSAAGGGSNAYVSYPSLADRVAQEMNWVALAIQFRGTGESEGQFSLAGWHEDLTAAIEHVHQVERILGVWLVGFGTGGSLAICAGAANGRVRGVAAVAAPADFADWAGNPRALLEHARRLGIVTDDSFPASMSAWSRELSEIRAEQAARTLAPRPLLVMHGDEDDVVPVFDARAVADAHGDADLRVLNGGAHRLRHDPRAVAVLLDWLDRQQRKSRPGASASEPT